MLTLSFQTELLVLESWHKGREQHPFRQESGGGQKNDQARPMVGP